MVQFPIASDDHTALAQHTAAVVVVVSVYRDRVIASYVSPYKGEER